MIDICRIAMQIETRLAEMDREWDVERTLETNASTALDGRELSNCTFPDDKLPFDGCGV